MRTGRLSPQSRRPILSGAVHRLAAFIHRISQTDNGGTKKRSPETDAALDRTLAVLAEQGFGLPENPRDALARALVAVAIWDFAIANAR